jgi:hypothetical protein
VGAAEGLRRRTASLIPNAPLGLGLPGGPAGKLFPDGAREMREELDRASRRVGGSRAVRGLRGRSQSAHRQPSEASVVGVVGSSVSQM